MQGAEEQEGAVTEGPWLRTKWEVEDLGQRDSTTDNGAEEEAWKKIEE